MLPDSPSVVIQVDIHNAKGKSNVQHVSGDPHEAAQLVDTAKMPSIQENLGAVGSRDSVVSLPS